MKDLTAVQYITRPSGRAVMRCDKCGKFCIHLNEVSGPAYWNGPDHVECDKCFEEWQ